MAGASLRSPAGRFRHPLFVPLFLMLQPGVRHRVSPETGREKGDRRREEEGKQETGRNKEKTGTTGEDDNVNVRLLRGSPCQLICISKETRWGC